jgi:sugar lactone lactonase YvrE
MRASFTSPVLALLVAGGVVFPLRAAAPASPPPAGTIVTVAGNGKDGYAGDNGPASKAVFLGPLGLAVDAAGDLLVGDFFNNRVRMIRPDGTITTIAGNGQPSTSGDGRLATKAGVKGPDGLAVDAEGNLYIGELFDGRVRKVSPDGIITTVAGGGHPADGLGDGGPATQAAMASVGGIALDKKGNLFICDYDDGLIRKVGLDGMISTVAGGGNPADGIGDGGLATDAQLASPHDVLVDGQGNLIIADSVHNRVRMVRPDGTIFTMAGTGVPGYSGDGGTATAAQLSIPFYLAMDPGGNLFIADNRNSCVRKVDPAGVITTVAGTGAAGFTGDNGPATAARLRGACGLAVDALGNLFFTDYKRIDPTGNSFEASSNSRVREVFGVAVPR